MMIENNEKMEKLMRVDEIARILDVSEITVRRLVYKGSLEAIKVGEQLRFKREQVEKYLQGASTAKTKIK